MGSVAKFIVAPFVGQQMPHASISYGSRKMKRADSLLNGAHQHRRVDRELVGGRVLLDSRRVNPGFRLAHGVLLDPGRVGGYPWNLM